LFPKEDVTDSAMQTASAVNPFSVVCKTRKECGKTKRSTESQVVMVAGGGEGEPKGKTTDFPLRCQLQLNILRTD